MVQLDGETLKSVAMALFTKLNLKIIIYLIIISVILVLFYKRSKSLKLQRFKENIDTNCGKIHAQATIFVSLPNLNDSEIGATLHSIFNNAYCPRRVFVGVFQNLTADESNHCSSYKHMLGSADHSFWDNIRVMTDPIDEAEGIDYARSMIEQYLYRDEKYILMIDSHTVLKQNWDLLCIQQLERCSYMSKNPILTYIPEYVDSINKNSTIKRDDLKTTFMKLDKSIKADNNIPKIISSPNQGAIVKPLTSLFWSSKFSFSLASIIRNVPHGDTELYLLSPTGGSDLLYGARLWTNGYDFFTPTIPIALHVRHSNSVIIKTPSSTIKKLENIFFSQQLGKKRSFEQWMNFTGLQIQNKKFSTKKINGFLGLPAHASFEEIMGRYGSLTKFYKESNLLV